MEKAERRFFFLCMDSYLCASFGLYTRDEGLDAQFQSDVQMHGPMAAARKYRQLP